MKMQPQCGIHGYYSGKRDKATMIILIVYAVRRTQYDIPYRSWSWKVWGEGVSLNLNLNLDQNSKGEQNAASKYTYTTLHYVDTR